MSNSVDPDETVHDKTSIIDYGSERVKPSEISRPITYESTGAVAKLLDCPPCVRKVVCSIPGQPIPKNLNMILL